jgi:hypothetical protein
LLRIALITTLIPFSTAGQGQSSTEFIIPDSVRHHIEFFNSMDEESIRNAISNDQCWDWMLENIPWFECPDKEIEQLYYYRWWVYRKHIRHTPNGFVVTEFLPEVGHAGKYNTIACAAGLHIDEGRWLRNRSYTSDYIRFWFSEDGHPRQYSAWFADAIYRYCMTIGDFSMAKAVFNPLIENYRAWEQSNQHSSGLFWSYDDRDGGEYSISGSGLRPTLNSYMYADAAAISRLAKRFNKVEIQQEFEEKARKLKHLVQTEIWDEQAQFFMTIPMDSKEGSIESPDFGPMPASRRVRELYGYLPWKFFLPDAGYEQAWTEINDQRGFSAPYGPTTAEQRHPLFMKNRIKRCQWDGSSWPYATSLTIGAMINLLRHYDQQNIGKQDFFRLLKTYTRSQHRTLPYGEKIPWIGESLHPYSGIWLSRAIALEMSIPSVKKRPTVKDKNAAVIRGKDYNHSSYCDLVISGLAGLEIQDDGVMIVDPLITEDMMPWFCMEGVAYAGKSITIMYDKTGDRYHQGAGLHVYVDGKIIAHSPEITTMTVKIERPDDR